MHEEVNDKTIAIVINGGKISAEILKKALSDLLNKRKVKQVKKEKHGKMRYKQLAKKDTGLQTIEITDKNIKSFSRIAKKYKVDFSLKKDKSENPPKYIVFFKGRDTDVLNLAFREFTKKQLTKKKSIINTLNSFKKLISINKNLDKDKQRTKDRGVEI